MRAFIFTLDAVLALIPVFIILGSVTMINTQESLRYHSEAVDASKVANDVLESMKITGDINSNDVVRIGSLLNLLVPERYNYSYEVYTPDGALYLRVSRGDISRAKNVYTAYKTATITTLHIEDAAFAISHGGVTATQPYCQNGGQYIWELSFIYAPQRFNYYLVGYKDENLRVFYLLTDQRRNCTPSLAGDISYVFMQTTENFKRIPLLEGNTYTGTTLTRGNTYYVYIRPEGNPSRTMDFFIITTPLTIPENEVVYNKIFRMDRYFVRLRLWVEE